MGSYSVIDAELESAILLPQLLECMDHRYIYAWWPA